MFALAPPTSRRCLCYELTMSAPALEHPSPFVLSAVVSLICFPSSGPWSSFPPAVQHFDDRLPSSGSPGWVLHSQRYYAVAPTSSNPSHGLAYGFWYLDSTARSLPALTRPVVRGLGFGLPGSLTGIQLSRRLKDLSRSWEALCVFDVVCDPGWSDIPNQLGISVLPLRHPSHKGTKQL